MMLEGRLSRNTVLPGARCGPCHKSSRLLGQREAIYPCLSLSQTGLNPELIQILLLRKVRGWQPVKQPGPAWLALLWLALSPRACDSSGTSLLEVCGTRLSIGKGCWQHREVPATGKAEVDAPLGWHPEPLHLPWAASEAAPLLLPVATKDSLGARPEPRNP